MDVYYNEGRNEFAANFYIVPILKSLLTPALAEANANISVQFVAANAGNQTALAHFVEAISKPSTRAVASATYNNLRPFTAPVVSALTEVGMILIVIFSFILVRPVFIECDHPANSIAHRPWPTVRCVLSLRDT